MFNGYVGEHCTDFSEWVFELPGKLAVEIKDRYHIPKYRIVRNENRKEYLFLDFDSICLEYCLSSYNDDWQNKGDYIGDDYRIAKEYEGVENIYLCWSYDCLYDDGCIDLYGACVGDEFTNIFEPGYEYDYDQEEPSVEIVGDDKEELLKILHPLMEKIIDGEKSIKDKLYQFNGD